MQKKNINIITANKNSGLDMTSRILIQSLRKKYNVNLFYIFKIKKIKNFQINIFVGNPDLVSHFIKKNYLKFITSYNIGYFFWELEKIPFKWKVLTKIMNQIWVQTDFIKKIFFPFNKSTYKIPLFYPSYEIQKLKDKRINNILNNKNNKIFLAIFDFSSYFYRKNIISTINIFNKLGNKNLFLIIKSHNGEKYKNQKKEVTKLIQNNHNIVFIDKFIEINELNYLIKKCNFYISTHRSEGLGLNLLHAFVENQIVIGTNYSGNTEFMHSKNSLPLEYKMRKVTKHEYIYSENQYWADVDVDDSVIRILNLLSKEKLQTKLKSNMKKDIEKIKNIKYFESFLNEHLPN